MVALVRLELTAVAGTELVERVPGQRAVARERRDLVVQVPGGRPVGVAQVLQPLGQREHPGDVLRGARELVRWEDVHERGVGVEGSLVRVRDLAGGAALEARGDEHRVDLATGVVRAEVAHVGDVLDLEDLDAVVHERAADQVGEQERPQVADVGVAVDGGAAGIHPEPTGLDRHDRHHGPPERIAQAEGHRREFRFSASTAPSLTNRCGFALSATGPRGAASFPRRCARGAFPSDSTPCRILAPMRQWARVVALLLGLAGNGYVATVRPRIPVAIERRLEPRILEGRTLRTLDWWRA